MMRFSIRVVLGVLSVGVLAGCASGAGEGEPSLPVAPMPGSPTASPAVDIEAQTRAQSWVDQAVLPVGAVRSDTSPPTTGGWGNARDAWWCSPMELREAYWTVPGTTVIETATWLSDNPTADLMVPIPFKVVSDEQPVTIATVLNYPSSDSLEGIIYTVSAAGDGVAIRSLVGVIPEMATCPTPEPGTDLGGPGMG